MRCWTPLPAILPLLGGGLLSAVVKAGNELPGSNRHILITPSGGSFVRAALKWGDIVTSGKTAVRALIEFTPTNGINTQISIFPGCVVSGSGTSTTRTGYVHWYRDNDAISKYNNGSDGSIATRVITLSTSLIRLYVETTRDGSTIEVRSWLYGGSRPTIPDLTITDASPLPVSGWVGFSYLAGSAAPTGKLLSIAAATNGDAVPTGPVGGSVTLSVDSLSLSMAMDSATLTQSNQLIVDDLQCQGSLDAVTLQQANVISPDEITLTSQLDSAVLVSAGQLSVNDLQLNMTMEATELQQANQLSVDSLLLTTTFESPDLSVGLTLVPDSIWLSALLDQVTLTQSHLLTVDDLTQSISLDNVTLTVAGQVIGPGTLTIGITGPSISIGISP